METIKSNLMQLNQITKINSNTFADVNNILEIFKKILINMHEYILNENTNKDNFVQNNNNSDNR